MKKYIALLRGINVGGNNKIAMSELKKAFEISGFENVTTYINSGNVIFSSSITNEDELRQKCEELIKIHFALKIIVAIISAQSLIDALNNAPEWWDKDIESKHNAIFVIKPYTASQLVQEVGDIKPQYEQTAFLGQVIFWSAPITTFSHTRWSKVVSTSSSNYVTIRNANTAKKLMQLVKI